MKKTIFIFSVLLFISLHSQIISQVDKQIQKYRDDQYGNRQFRREMVLDGNNIRTLFYNKGEIGQWPYTPSFEWPAGSYHNYFDGFTFLVAAEVTAPGNCNIIHPLEISYREWMDVDPVTATVWGIEPVPGYMDNGSDTPAISTDPQSWPDHWPSALPGVNETWDGKWYGYFGKNVFRADLETFFVMDDSKDGEFKRAPYNFYPVISDSNRGGLGLRIEVRSFQWANQLLKDIIFVQYDVINISDYNYPKAVFGFFGDTGVGGSGDNEDDVAAFDQSNNLVYAYDYDGYGSPGHWTTGYIGFAVLHTPDNSSNSIDDDNDGMIDESKYDGLDNDGDWRIYDDLNNNGLWDKNEPLNDDVGKDGLCSQDSNYPGKDDGEGDGLPTLGEPRFDKTDPHESDMIGLTGISIYAQGSVGTGGGWPKDDESMWTKLTSATYDTLLENNNINLTLSSGPTEFGIGDFQRMSTAIIISEDYESLLFKKVNAQKAFYENYPFNELLNIPVEIISPIPSQVINGIYEVSWDYDEYQPEEVTAYISLSSDGGSTYSLAGTAYNTNKFNLNSVEFQDGIFYKIKIECVDLWGKGVGITEGYITINNEGNAPPQFMFLINTDFGFTVRDLFTLKWFAGDADGDETSISFYYTDPIYVPEKHYIITDLNASVSEFNWNTQALENKNGYELIAELTDKKETVTVKCGHFNALNSWQVFSGKEYTMFRNTIGTGVFYILACVPRELTGDNYEIQFVKPPDSLEVCYNIKNLSTNQILVSNAKILNSKEGAMFEGMRIKILGNDRHFPIDSLCKWLIGKNNVKLTFEVDNSSLSRNVYWPADYRLEFQSENNYTTPFFKIPANLKIFNVTDAYYTNFEIFDNDGDNKLSLGDEFVILEDYPGVNYKLTWRCHYDSPVDGSDAILPQPGDQYLLSVTKPFRDGDVIQFATADLPVGIENENEYNELTFGLEQNYPNPFNPATKISYRLSTIGKTTLKIYDILGREIATLVDAEQKPGTYSVNFDGSSLSSGVYFYQLKAGSYVDTRKMLLLK